MRAPPSIHYCQERVLPDDAHPCPGHFIPADAPPVGGRMISFDLLLPVEKVIRPFHRVRFDGSRRRPARFLPVQQVLQTVANRSIHLSVLSSHIRLAGFQTSEASNGRVPKSCGAFPKVCGGFINVGC